MPFGDAASLARDVTTLVQDPAHGANWARRGKKRPDRFSAEVIVPRYKALYRRYVTLPGAGAG